MVDISIETEGLEQVYEKFKNAPKTLEHNMDKAMKASLLTLQKNVPSYPPKPTDSAYVRTGTLGRSIGAGGGKPTIYSHSAFEGRFGTNLSYAPYVIGPETQAYMHKPGFKGRQGWWTMNTIKEKAIAKIMQIWDDFVRIALE